MEEMRITAERTEEGYRFEAYDAETLFNEGTDLLGQNRCADAVVRYERVADEFAGSRYVSPSLYNAGLCLQEAGERERAVAQYERLISLVPASPDVKHATFQLALLFVDLERWDDALTTADTLLRREDLSSDERVEAMARRAQALLGARRLAEAAEQARSTLSYARTRPEENEVRDVLFIATANFVLAESYRLRAEAIEVPPGTPQEQHDVLERRAQLILDGQRAYFDTIRRGNALLSSASGYRIGEMYDTFWHAIMAAPVPPPRTPIAAEHMPVYEEEYRNELKRLIKPLIRHAINYWELTLMMIERTGVRSEWRDRIHADLERARQRLLEQPPGPGGLPPRPDASGGTD
jgi:tetratricopeptide (TPR) repeat protein